MIYKTQSALHCIGKYATIVQPNKYGRGVGGGFGLVHDIFWREEKPWVVLKLPTGRRLAVPAALTDLPFRMFSKPQQSVETEVPALLALAQFCMHCRARVGRRAEKKSSAEIQSRK
jgi:hypothetical protein